MRSSLQGKLSVERMCTLAQVSRAGFYRWLQKKEPTAEETAVRAAIQEVAVQHHRRYEYRRIAAQLPSRDGGEPQACSPHDAGRQSAGDPHTKVRLDHRFQSFD